MAADQEVVIWARLTRVREFLLNAQKEALAIRQLGIETERARHRTFLFNQALFTARRFLYTGTLAAIAFTAVMVKWGFSLFTTLENATVAMTQFLGSEQAAKQELQFLYDLAARTPFTFENIVEATRRFLAFGFSLQETNKYMKVIGDTAAGLGGDAADNINRLVLVFGQMHAAGRVLGNDMLQLASLGINAREMLARAFNLTPKQKANMGLLHIPADQAIAVIMHDLQFGTPGTSFRGFLGQAEKQARTLQGRISTLHDYVQQFFMMLVSPLAIKARDDIIPALTGWLKMMTEVMKTQGPWGVIEALDETFGLHGFLVRGIKTVAYWWGILSDTIDQLIGPLKIVLGLFLLVVTYFAAIAYVASLFIRLANALHLTNVAGYIAAGVLTLLILDMVRARTVTLALATARAIDTAYVYAGVTALRIYTAAIVVYETWVLRAEYATVIWGATTAFFTGLVETLTLWLWGMQYAIKANVVAITLYEAWILRAELATAAWAAITAFVTGAIELLTYGMFALGYAIEATPIGWIITAIALLIISIALLIIYWDQVKAAMVTLFDWVKSHWPLLAVAILGPIAAPILAIMLLFHRLVDTAQWAWGQIRNIFSRSINPFGGGWFHLPGWIPHFAEGGPVTHTGMALVGERGPELVHLPRGAQVTAHGAAIQVEGVLEAPVVLKMDTRKIAEGVARWRLRTAATQ